MLSIRQDSEISTEPHKSLTFTTEKISRWVGSAGGYGSGNGCRGGDGAGCGGEEW